MTQTKLQAANLTNVAIVGAGPYGLSIAAHLAEFGISFRIFGKPMSAWADQMPKGMLLKSEGFASSLSDPGSAFTLGKYCHQQGLPYQDTMLPIPLDTFVAYGQAFQRRFVPNLENKVVVSIRRSLSGFNLELEDGESVLAQRVILAVGIAQFAHVPEVFAGLPGEFVSHSSAHSDLQRFANRRVAVIGAGASALDLTALLHKTGALVEVVARGPAIRFFDPPQPRSLRERILSPATGLGTGFDFLFYCNAPHIFRLLPERLRLNRVQKTLGPRPGWFVRDEVVGKVPVHLNARVAGASVVNGCVHLCLTEEKETGTLEFDHVIAATGYRVDLSRMGILSNDLLGGIRRTGRSPRLSAHFESSVPGLYFVGVTAANTFGPLMRFACGAQFTSRRITKHLVNSTRRSPVLIDHPVVQRSYE